MKIICLTGGFASGKSTAAKFMEEKGANIIDADRLGHRAYDIGTHPYRQVIDTFGPEVVADDNDIDREALGNKVFGKPEELKKKMVHDIIGAAIGSETSRMLDEVAKSRGGAAVLSTLVGSPAFQQQ